MVLIAASTLVGIAGFAGLLQLIPRLGAAGTRIAAWLCRAPGLDLVVSLVTWIPPTVLGIVFGWRGVAGAIIGQVLGMLVWMFVHELANRRYVRGPRIVTFLNRTVGRLNNHIALWATAVAVPVFLFIRVAELLIYPVLTRLAGLPRYRHADWVNVSRQKFHGLVGHDLIWCLYCDWMTGVYALGAEILRNVESFLCPIRFANGKKCDNCKLDFPDIHGGWDHERRRGDHGKDVRCVGDSGPAARPAAPVVRAPGAHGGGGKGDGCDLTASNQYAPAAIRTRDLRLRRRHRPATTNAGRCRFRHLRESRVGQRQPATAALLPPLLPRVASCRGRQ